MQPFNEKSPVYEIAEETKAPKYLQIIDCITNAIKRGELRKGDKIFSINQFSNECFLSRDTVQKAYEVLERAELFMLYGVKDFISAVPTLLSIYEYYWYLIN